MSNRPPPQTRWRASARRLSRVTLLAALALIVSFAALEFAVRALVDMRHLHSQGIRLIDREHPIRFQPGVSHTFVSPEQTYTVSFNRFGRRDVEWSDATVADPRSIVFIGDSFVIGNGVEHPDTLPSQLEGLFASRGDPREVMNFGMPHGNPVRYRLALDDALTLGFAGQTIAVGVFIGNDFYPRVLTEIGRPPSPPPPPRANPREEHSLRSHLIPYVRARVSQSPLLMGWILRIGNALGLNLYQTPGSYIFRRHPTPDEGLRFERVLDQIGELARNSDRNGRELRVVIFPNKLQVENGEDLNSQTLDSTRPNRMILDYCAKHAISCFDLLPVLEREYRETGTPVFFAMDRHLNPQGNRVAADALVEFLGSP